MLSCKPGGATPTERSPPFARTDSDTDLYGLRCELTPGLDASIPSPHNATIVDAHLARPASAADGCSARGLG